MTVKILKYRTTHDRSEKQSSASVGKCMSEQLKLLLKADEVQHQPSLNRDGIP